MSVNSSFHLNNTESVTAGLNFFQHFSFIRYSEICKKQKNGLAGSRDADGRKKNT